jgi:histidinol phosphatase-like PHP family hydrolase
MTPPEADYHVHYYLDHCGAPEMTAPNIAAEALRLGLEEICIVKHYTRSLPNGGRKWASWKRVGDENFDRFLDEVRSFQPPEGLTVFAGAETELLSDGNINMPPYQAERLDAVLLSAHWLPPGRAPAPHPDVLPGRVDAVNPRAAAEWRQQVAEAGPEIFLQDLVQSYVSAVERHPCIRVLAHMGDGLFPLREFEVPVDRLPQARIVEIMEPLMRTAARERVLWEMNPNPPKQEAVVKRADELGVRFCATADAHFIEIEGFALMHEHEDARRLVESLGLTRGRLTPART